MHTPAPTSSNSSVTVTAAATAPLLLEDESQFTKTDSNHFHLLRLYNCQCYSHFTHTEAAHLSHCVFSHWCSHIEWSYLQYERVNTAFIVCFRSQDLLTSLQNTASMQMVYIYNVGVHLYYRLQLLYSPVYPTCLQTTIASSAVHSFSPSQSVTQAWLLLQ